MHKVVCSFCELSQKEAPSNTQFIEFRDKKAYICTNCLALCQKAIALNWKEHGGVLKSVKDSL